MDEDDELVGGDDEDSGAEEFEDTPPLPPEERDEDDNVDSVFGDDEDNEDVAAETTAATAEAAAATTEAAEAAAAAEAEDGDEDEELAEDMDADEDPELDSDCSVPYNRQFYAVPNSAVVRDYTNVLKVSCIERLSEMAAPSPPPEKWPSVDMIEASMIVVLRGKIAANDSKQRYIWYLRIAVIGEDGNGDDKDIFRPIPRAVVKKLVAHYRTRANMKTSSLLTKYVPYDDNNRPLNPSKLHNNNWNLRKPPPKTIAQALIKEVKEPKEPKAAASSSGKRPASDDAPTELVAKKAKQGTGGAKAPAKAGAKPTKASTSAAPKPKPPTTAATKAKPKPPSTTAAPDSSKTASAHNSPTAAPTSAPSAPSAPPPPQITATDGASRDQVVPMKSIIDLGPSPGHTMVNTVTVSNTTYNPETTSYTVTFPSWVKFWKIKAEFTGGERDSFE